MQNQKLYLVAKSKHEGDFPTRSPTCDRAGVSAGVFFTSLAEAEKAASRLTDYNPVGFTVHEVSVCVDCASTLKLDYA